MLQEVWKHNHMLQILGRETNGNAKGDVLG